MCVCTVLRYTLIKTFSQLAFAHRIFSGESIIWRFIVGDGDDSDFLRMRTNEKRGEKLNERVVGMMKHMYGDIFYANYVIERTHDFWLSTFKPIYMCVTLDLFSPFPSSLSFALCIKYIQYMQQ